MSYASGGLIQATDYNGFVGGATTPTGTINYVWSTGNGQYGYGQTALPTVSSTGVVYATQWATAINTINLISKHQSGSVTSLTAPSAGSLIAYLSAVTTSIATINTNHLANAVAGTTVVGATFNPGETVSNQQAAATFVITRTVTFNGGPDAARYFFNAGGRLNLIISAVNNDGSGRSGDMVSLLNGNIGGITNFAATTNSGRIGSGGTSATNLTSAGYYNITTSNTTIVQATSTTSGYTSDYANIFVSTNGVQGTNADNGTVLKFSIGMYSAARPTLPAPPAAAPGGTAPTTNTIVNDTINVTVNHHIDVVYPELTNITANTWGAVSIT
jgi:hypothetical protein